MGNQTGGSIISDLMDFLKTYWKRLSIGVFLISLIGKVGGLTLLFIVVPSFSLAWLFAHLVNKNALKIQSDKLERQLERQRINFEAHEKKVRSDHLKRGREFHRFFKNRIVLPDNSGALFSVVFSVDETYFEPENRLCARILTEPFHGVQPDSIPVTPHQFFVVQIPPDRPHSNEVVKIEARSIGSSFAHWWDSREPEKGFPLEEDYLTVGLRSFHYLYLYRNKLVAGPAVHDLTDEEVTIEVKHAVVEFFKERELAFHRSEEERKQKLEVERMQLEEKQRELKRKQREIEGFETKNG